MTPVGNKNGTNTAAFREVLAYEVLALMEFVTPRVRRATIEYLDTTPPTHSSSAVGWQLTREALIVEDIEVVAERFSDQKSAIESHIAAAKIDAEGRANALRHIVAFYDALEVIK